MTDRQTDRQTEWNDNKAHSLRCERDATAADNACICHNEKTKSGVLVELTMDEVL